MKERSINENIILNVIYTISNIVIPLITYPYAARVLETSGIGKVSFFTAIGSYASLFASLGINTYGIRATARVRDDQMELSKTVYELIILNLVATIFVVGILLASAPFVKAFKNDYILLILNCINVFISVFGLNWLYSGLEQYTYITVRSIFFRFLSTVLIFLLVKSKEDYCTYAFLIIFSNIGASICNMLYAKKFVIKLSRTKLKFKRHIQPMLLLFSSILAINIYTNLDTVMLGFICGDVEVGLYSVAVKVKYVLLSVVFAISSALLPRLSYYVGREKEKEFNGLIVNSINFIFLLSFPMILFFVIQAPETLLLIGGRGYEKAVVSMRILMPIVLVSGFSNIIGNQILIPMNKDKDFMKAVCTGAVADLIFNTLLMPSMGATGASMATLAAELIQMLIQVKYAKKYLINNIDYHAIFKMLMAALLSSLMLIIWNNIKGINRIPFFSLLTGIIIFFLIYISLVIIFREQTFIKVLKKISDKLIRNEHGK